MGSAWKTENFVGVVYKNPLSGNQCCQLEIIFCDRFQEKRLITIVCLESSLDNIVADFSRQNLCVGWRIIR